MYAEHDKGINEEKNMDVNIKSDYYNPLTN